MNTPYTLTLPALDPDQASGKAGALLQGARQQLGFVPNMFRAMAHAPALLETYMQGYEAFRAESGFTPEEQEVVLLTISRFNGCRYCMAAHSTLAAEVAKVPDAVLTALRDGQPLPEQRLAVLQQLVNAMLESRGQPDTATVQAFLNAGYTERQLLYIVLVMAVQTLSNYANHLGQPELDAAFSGRRWPA